jgi:hypothetical protein
MRIRRIAISVAFAAGLVTLPLSAAKAQYNPPLLADSTVLADLRGGRRSRYRHDNHHCAAPSAHGGRRPSTTCVTGRRPVTHRRPTRRDITRRRIILGHAEPACVAALA